jgi:hypothetical protein
MTKNQYFIFSFALLICSGVLVSPYALNPTAIDKTGDIVYAVIFFIVGGIGFWRSAGKE